MFRVRLLLLLICVFMLVLPVSAQDTLINLGSTERFGDVLVGPDGFTLYMFTVDPLDETVCYGQCAENWPPLVVDSADAITVAEGIPGEFTTVERTDGTLQVALNGMPLYYWARDTAAGDTTGNDVGHVWYVLPPATVYAFRHGDTAPYLVDSNGMTLYIFSNDTEGISTCYDQCAENWPALTVASAEDLVPGVNLAGEWGTSERTDGTLQVTYNGMPLYYWAQDMARGDTNGQGMGDVWFTVAPETVGVSSSEELGDYLIAPNGMTLYKFDNDAAGVSNCADDCATNWPPYTIDPNDPLVSSPAAMGELGTLTRADDTVQVTYNGAPLYYWAQDALPGDTTGQGVGEVWWVVAP